MALAGLSQKREETILVVEDEEPIRELVSTALRFTGFHVELQPRAVPHSRRLATEPSIS